MNIVGKRKLWFAISILILVPGILALIFWGLKPGIDFTGGQVMEVAGGQNQSAVATLVAGMGVHDGARHRQDCRLAVQRLADDA